jgi:hypothetical protein
VIMRYAEVLRLRDKNTRYLNGVKACPLRISVKTSSTYLKSPIMSRKYQSMKKRRSESNRAKTQQRARRRRGLFKKAAEYTIECESDVFMVIRTRKNGQIYTFDSSTTEEWLPSLSKLVCHRRTFSFPNSTYESRIHTIRLLLRRR